MIIIDLLIVTTNFYDFKWYKNNIKNSDVK